MEAEEETVVTTNGENEVSRSHSTTVVASHRGKDGTLGGVMRESNQK